MPANAMGRRATVVIPPPAPQKNDAASAEAGAEFDSLMKETSAPTKAENDANASNHDESQDKAMVQGAEETHSSSDEDFDTVDAQAVVESQPDGESLEEAPVPAPEVAVAPVLVEEELTGEAFLSEVLVEKPAATSEIQTNQKLESRSSAARQPNAMLESGRQAPRMTEQMLASMTDTKKSADAVTDPKSSILQPTKLGQMVETAAAQLARVTERADSRERAPSLATQPGNSGGATKQEGVLSTSSSNPVESSQEFRGEKLEKPLDQAPKKSSALGARVGASAGVASPTVASADVSAQPASRIPTGFAALDPGAAEQDPLQGSVKLNGIRGARVAVAMGDGSVVRARVDLVDDSLDVALRASEEVGLRADQRVGELREALADKGIDLGEFDVSADAGENEAAGDGEESAEAGSNDGKSEGDGSSELRDLDVELEELRANNGFGYYDDGGTGALINRRL